MKQRTTLWEIDLEFSKAQDLVLIWCIYYKISTAVYNVVSLFKYAWNTGVYVCIEYHI